MGHTVGGKVSQILRILLSSRNFYASTLFFFFSSAFRLCTEVAYFYVKGPALLDIILDIPCCELHHNRGTYSRYIPCSVKNHVNGSQMFW